jgi:hypothetical protein
MRNRVLVRRLRRVDKRGRRLGLVSYELAAKSTSYA